MISDFGGHTRQFALTKDAANRGLIAAFRLLKSTGTLATETGALKESIDDDRLSRARSLGFDVDTKHGEATSYVILDPRNLRRHDASFDPANVDSDDLRS